MHRRPPRPAQRTDLLGLAWVVAAGVAVLVPALIHGRIFGPFDLLSRAGLTAQHGVQVHILQNSDLANSLLPWWTIAWQQVHAGHLPLWNPNGGLGMPLAFNWQSAPFSLPALVGYLAPLRYAFTVSVVVTIVVGGSGAYVLGRVLRIGVVGAAAVGTVFELSGPITAWLGYPFPAVMSLGGWILAFGILLVRGRHRARYVAALAVSFALSIYGGDPEGFAALSVAVAVFFVVLLLGRTAWMGGEGPILRPARDLVVAAVAGGALAAPLALPGLEAVSRSVRSTPAGASNLTPHALVYLIFTNFDGLPIIRNGGAAIFGLNGLFYTETAAYVGIAAIALAALSVVVHRRRPDVRALAVAAIVCVALATVPQVDRLAGAIPLVGKVSWDRALMPLALLIAVLAGFGIDFVVRSAAVERVGHMLAVAFGAASLVLAALWLFGRGALNPTDARVRAHSFIWPTIEVAIGLASAGFLSWVGYVRRKHLRAVGTASTRGTNGSRADRYRRSRRFLPLAAAASALALLGVQTVFLVNAGAQMIQTSPAWFPQTPAIHKLVSTVGSSTVGFAIHTCSFGIEPNVNGVYGVHDLSVYDPIIPKDYFTAWPADTGTAAGTPGFNLFCPAVTSVVAAREFGVRFVLAPLGHPGPVGSSFVERIGNEDLYRIPGAAQATVSPLADGAFPADSAAGAPVAVGHSSPTEWQLETSSAHPQALRFHLTDTPGWQATIDGKPLRLVPYAGMMLQARIPPGRHSIVLRYLPTTFVAGVVLAVLTVLGLLVLLLVSARRHRSQPSAASPAGRSAVR
ncbi:MAG: YfhO family protein [Acidimicrobiales bacterium]